MFCCQESHHKSAMEQVYSADRASLLAEIRDVRAHNNVLQLDLQDERQKLAQQLSSLEEHGTRREKQLMRQCKFGKWSVEIYADKSERLVK